MQNQGRIAVLLHTFDNRGPTWLTAVWGTPKNPGRIPTAVAAAIESDAVLLLVFSEELSGQNTGALIRDYLFEHIEELSEFVPSLPVLGEHSSGEIREILERIFLLSDVLIVNTADEIVSALPIFAESNIDSVIFVSNFDHVSRVAQLLGEIWGDRGVMRPTVTIRPAWSLYSTGSMGEVVVFEPPAVQQLDPVDPRRLLGLRNRHDDLRQVDELLKGLGV